MLRYYGPWNPASQHHVRPNRKFADFPTFARTSNSVWARRNTHWRSYEARHHMAHERIRLRLGLAMDESRLLQQPFHLIKLQVLWVRDNTETLLSCRRWICPEREMAATECWPDFVTPLPGEGFSEIGAGPHNHCHYGIYRHLRYGVKFVLFLVGRTRFGRCILASRAVEFRRHRDVRNCLCDKSGSGRWDSNPRSSVYETDEIDHFSTPHQNRNPI